MTEKYSMEHLFSRITAIESHMINIIIPLQEINKVASVLGKPLQLDARDVKEGLRSILIQMEEFFQKIKETTRTLQSLDLLSSLEEFQKVIKEINLKQAFLEIQYIGNRLKSVDKSIAEIKEQGIKKQINLEFTCDGYEMVKNPVHLKKIKEPVDEPNEALEYLLNSLLARERDVITHRLGMFFERKKTYDEIGKIIGVSRERASQIYSKAIRKLRHPSRNKYVDKITHKELLKEIKGK